MIFNPMKLTKIVLIILHIKKCFGDFDVFSHKNGFGDYKFISRQLLDDFSQLIKNVSMESGCKYIVVRDFKT